MHLTHLVLPRGKSKEFFGQVYMYDVLVNSDFDKRVPQLFNGWSSDLKRNKEDSFAWSAKY